MPLEIETFSNIHGGNAFFKAISHPLAAAKVETLLAVLRAKGSIAIYDPYAQAAAFAQFYPLNDLPITGYYVQDVEKESQFFGSVKAQLVTALKDSKAAVLFVTTFDAAKLIDQIRHLLPANISIHSFDDLRLPVEMLSDKGKYLSPLNFATNFVFYRDCGGQHTRIVSTNYWGSYGAKEASFWCRLYSANGELLAEWEDRLGAPASAILIDSKDIRARFNLPEFTGQLFIHALHVQGHDIVKYALDTYGDDEKVLSCTHDANSWPSDYYAGLPAPGEGEEVVLWVQNSMPFTIPVREIGMNVMGDAAVNFYGRIVPPFATVRLSVAELLPEARWPQQVEVTSGKYFVRPRYEVFGKTGRQNMAHVNVERSDLKPDPKLADLKIMGKGHILPASILPLDRYDSLILPTPMSRGLQHLPVKALINDANGECIAEYAFGNLPRNHAHLLTVNDVLKGKTLPSGYGHVELLYDFSAGVEADGWLHGLFRYVDRKTSHAAESSFGSHMFNSVLIYKNEPQSYAGHAPGLTTRLFLRLGKQPYGTMCHLVYPASTPWHAHSKTQLILTSFEGKEIETVQISIPCNGSLLWNAADTFSAKSLDAAGEGGYITVRDTTCRLFGYHGLTSAAAFSLDHMFGF